MKLDWHFCPWCYGEGFAPLSSREYPDKRYSAKCGNPACDRKDLMPFMRYCPWCHRRVRKKWKIDKTATSCSRCGWGVLPSYWTHCPWCAKGLPQPSG